MAKSLKIIVLIVVSFFGFVLNLQAQKQKILVVPYTRFQFVSEYKLAEIAKYNNVSENEVFGKYRKELINALIKANNEQVEFEVISELDYLSIKKQVKYSIEKFNGRKYNSTNINLVSPEQFTELLKKNQAQYLMFFNWYAIEKNVHTTYTGDNNKRNAFSLHKLDYDVYNDKKEKIIGKGNVKLDCGDFPSTTMVEEKGLKASSLINCYQGLIQDLLKELSSK